MLVYRSVLTWCVTITCSKEHCKRKNNSDTFYATGQSECLNEATKAGWRISEKRHLCPTCASEE